MKYHIKLNCHDWPHRGDKSVMKFTVDASGDVEAMQLGLRQAEQERPGAKLKVFDCERDRIEKFEMEQAQNVPRETTPEVPNISMAMKRGAYARKSP